MIKKKFKGIVICCENNRYIKDALEIKQFFNDLNIKVLFNYPSIGTCIKKDGLKNCLLICLTNAYVLKHKKGFIEPSKLKNKEKKIYLSKRVGKLFYCGIINKSKNDYYITIDMNLINRMVANPLDIILHEILHIKRIEECNTKSCMGHGGNVNNIYCQDSLCNNCLKLFKKIINTNFEKIKK